MQNVELESFVALIRSQFSAEEQSGIQADSDIKQHKEWSSLQTMIVVNEIDKKYNIILETEDIRNSNNLSDLFEIVKSKIS